MSQMNSNSFRLKEKTVGRSKKGKRTESLINGKEDEV